jgi:hypothetical protein
VAFVELELWERQTGVPVGTVSLRAGELTVAVADSAHRVLVERAMETGEITFAYVGYGDELTEATAKRLTPTWLVTVVLQILAPEGYRWNFTETDD